MATAMNVCLASDGCALPSRTHHYMEQESCTIRSTGRLRGIMHCFAFVVSGKPKPVHYKCYPRFRIMEASACLEHTTTL